MNRETDEQRAVSQTLCGALQKEANCKCLVLSVLIYGCLAAVTWCRCANVTKVVINFDNYPLKRTEHVSPCDEGYIYIPVAFMGMLYLVYLVECYHSPIRIDLLHAESQDNVMMKLSQLKLAQPTIWWKAVSYHYVRRKRQITRYRNGDNYTTTQVYYERSNTHAATSFYFYDYCGVKDISKELWMEPRVPITKITLTKGFAFSNMRSATEFEEARSRFFAEQELRDDYMEMREGLDLGYNFNPTNVVGILGSPWFTNAYVYWLLSAMLLSWPLRIIIEYNTQYADYQVTKLFGVNYDTPTSGEQIHASSSQLSAPGSYMLAPSYSEALLMDPSPLAQNCQQSDQSSTDDVRLLSHPSEADIVPSYSEALLYERAQLQHLTPLDASQSASESQSYDNRPGTCHCYCHLSITQGEDRVTIDPTEQTAIPSPSSCYEIQTICNKCRIDFKRARKLADPQPNFRRNSSDNSLESAITKDHRGKSNLTRDLSAPNFQTHCESIAVSHTQFLRKNANSLENILENEEPNDTGTSDLQSTNSTLGFRKTIGCGAIPKLKPTTSSGQDDSVVTGVHRLIENPMIDNDERGGSSLITSKTYFCLKSILKQHRRRYTLVTAEELRKLASDELIDQSPFTDKSARAAREARRTHQLFTRDNFFWRNRDASGASAPQPTTSFSDDKLRRSFVTSSRSLIFPSPIEEACRTMPNDPFGGKAVHVLPPRNEKPPNYEEAVDMARLAKLARSLTSIQHKSCTRERNQNGGKNGGRYHRRNLSMEPEYLLEASSWNTTTNPKHEDKASGDDSCDNEARNIGLSSDAGQQVAIVDESNSPGGIIARRSLTRGLSLNEASSRISRSDRNKRKILRTSLTDTTGGTSSFCFSDDQPCDEPNSFTSKRFNVSMETSL